MRSALILAAVAGLTTATPVAPRDTTAQDGIDLSVFDAEPKPTKIGRQLVLVPKSQHMTQQRRRPMLPKMQLTTLLCLQSQTWWLALRRAPTPTKSLTAMDLYRRQTPTVPSYRGLRLMTFQAKQWSPRGQKASVEGPGYQGLYTLTSYNPIQCQQYCDAAPACYGFNLFMERDPKFTPSDTCVDPESITNYKCTLWGAGVSEGAATNQGQWRNDFHVGISGSNGYNKNDPPAAITDFDGPIAFGGATQAPNSYMGAKYYPGPYDPSQCASACQATTQYDHDHPNSDGTYDACNFFNAYVLSENNIPQGTYCSMYTKPWDKSYSTNYGQYRGDDYYSVSQSYGYTLQVQDSGKIEVAPPV
ncbi:carbohydrate-binding-like protein [Colletotrichum tofieldiae]|nr:carbohydrate-binding-like protein [Colletotrichum tofieldiae]